MKTPTPGAVLAAAKEFVQRGWSPIPIPPGSKAPKIKGWQNLRLTKVDLPKHFDGRPQNLGVLLGEPSGGLVDVDLDCDEALLLAADFLPPTPMVHGRKSKPKSHWWYRTAPAPATEKFTDGPKGCLVELRSTGGQTVVPPSVHEKGEQIDWEGDLNPAEVNPNTLRKQVARLAAAVLLVKYWPKKGVRQDAALALAGGLLTDGWAPKDVEHFIVAISRAAKDKEWQKRKTAVKHTLQNLKQNKRITGWPRLGEVIGEKPAARLRGFLGLDRADGSPRHPQSVAEVIDAVLGAPKVPARIKRREAANLIIEDLTRRGRLIQSPGNRQFWFDRTGVRLHDVDGHSFRCVLVEAYKINPAEPEFRHTMEAIKSAVRTHGTAVSVFRFAYYSREKNVLYISAGQGRVLRLDGHTVTRLENGAEGVLFEEGEEPRVIPDEAISGPVSGDPLNESLLNHVNLVRGTGVILNATQQRLLLRVWIMSTFFSELLPAKVLLLLYGEKGSGKSTTLRAVLKLLLGPKANVTPLGKEDGFNAAVSQEHILGLDNVDSRCSWIEDRLATVATGQTIRMRKLYTTNESISFPTRCCVALTARTPRFRRDDVVDRLLILRVARLETFLRESDLYAEIEHRRIELWAQILHDLQKVLMCLGTGSVAIPESIRMADWGALACTIGKAIGAGEEVRTALKAAEIDKAAFLLETDALYDLLHQLAHERPNQEWKAGALFSELKARAEGAEIEFAITSPKSLGRILHRLEPALRLMVRFSIRTDAHDGQSTYALGPLPAQEDLPIGSGPQEDQGRFRDPDV